ncbi:response regulator transcription factor [Roseateles koreensis]|uniref:Response regulator n=1 Tax=Roseateles koreensis TaxID=2987526 RepID=A0ABT5KSP6_9BURK|nr:response regulator [Roseateles koreensis]MDC8785958.1 response regulator [Roseateles koreensis]
MKKILIVEDQSEIRELIKVTLEFEDYEIYEASNGPDALASAKRVTPDLILLDVMMPGGMDGTEVCKQVKSDSRLSRTRVIMLSAKSQVADKAAGVSAGADSYLTKPFSPMELLKSIKKVLR